MRKLDASEIFLIFANFIPILGIFFFEWNLFSVLITYWIETGVVGFYSFLKILYLIKKSKKKAIILSLVIGGFGTLAMYGGFMFGHFIGIMSIFSILPNGNGWTGLNLFANSIKEIFLMICIFLISHGQSFYFNFIKNKEFKVIEKEKANSPRTGQLLIGELIRIFIMQFIVIIGAFILAFTKMPIYAYSFFIILKIIIDLTMHRKKHFYFERNLQNKDKKISLISIKGGYSPK